MVDAVVDYRVVPVEVFFLAVGTVLLTGLLHLLAAQFLLPATFLLLTFLRSILVSVCLDLEDNGALLGNVDVILHCGEDFLELVEQLRCRRAKVVYLHNRLLCLGDKEGCFRFKGIRHTFPLNLFQKGLPSVEAGIMRGAACFISLWNLRCHKLHIAFVDND